MIVEAGLADAGLAIDPLLQLDAIATEAAGFDATNALLARGVAFDAVFAASDLIAIGALRALHAAGLRTPDDVAVAGFDDLRSRHRVPHPPYGQGRIAADAAAGQQHNSENRGGKQGSEFHRGV